MGFERIRQTGRARAFCRVRIVTGTITTWLDGRMQTVPADDPRVQAVESERVQTRHVANMRRLDLHGRRDYLANVERREGAESAAALKEAFRQDWMAKRGAPC